jgi:hypothetical protein
MQYGPAGSQVTTTKLDLTGGNPLPIDSYPRILDYLVMIGFYGLPLYYLHTFTANVNAAIHLFEVIKIQHQGTGYSGRISGISVNTASPIVSSQGTYLEFEVRI